LSLRTAMLQVTLATMVLAAIPARANEEPSPQRPDEFLVAWVKGSAKFDLFTEFHKKYPRSPHKRASEELEVAWRCLNLRDECGAGRATSLTKELLALYAAEDAPEGLQRRALHVLGRIRSPETLPLLCKVAGSATGDVRDAAIRSLGFFGQAPAMESFTVFGGKFWHVVLPPAPSEAATKTLVQVLSELRSARSSAMRLKDRREENRQVRHGAFVVLIALQSHRSAMVAAAALESLKEDGGAGRVVDWDMIGEVLVRNLDHIELKDLLARMKDKRRGVRRAAAYVLGWTGSPEAVSPLIRLLKDRDVWMTKKTQAALLRLSGVTPNYLAPVTKTAEEWIETLGKDGERLDPAKSIRYQDAKPGVYK